MPLFAISSLLGGEHYRGTAGDESEEGAGYGRSVCSESPGLHVDYNGTNNGLQHRKAKANLLNCVEVRIEGCNSPS